MSKKFDYHGAKQAGYSEEEINAFLMEQNPKFDFEGAKNAGYSSEEINDFLANKKPEKNVIKKAARIGTQLGLGAAERSLLPYEIATSPLASKEAQQVPYRENVMEDIENMAIQKASGRWTPKDEELFQHLQNQIKDTRKSGQFVKTADIGIRGLAEKATGLDLQPEGTLEKAANWTGFIKNPAKLADLKKAGLTVKDVIKTLSPSGKEVFRGLGAGTALQLAEEGNLGPIGTITAAVVGDVIGGGLPGLAKAATKPLKTAAKLTAKLTPKNSLELQKSIINDFRQSGIQADVGTLTNSPLVKMMQARLSASGLTGEALDKFRNELMEQVKNEYKGIANSLGEARFQTLQEAGEIGKETLSRVRDAEKETYKKFYDRSTNRLTDKAMVETPELARSIESLEKKLTPGSLKSEEQRKVLDVLDKIKTDIFDEAGNLKSVRVKELINNKVALNDIINWEVQGGQKQLLKDIAEELDKAIISYGKKDLLFAKNYVSANKKFSEHAKTFRNQNINRILRSEDPATLINRMNTPQGIKDIRNAFSKTSEGKEIFGNLARAKLDQILQKNMVDGVTEQLKLGKFTNVLETGKNREIVKTLLDPENYQRLLRLQKNTGKLAESAQKFFNASKTGTTAIDVAFIGKFLMDMSSLLNGNVWPVAKTLGVYGGTHLLTKFISNPKNLVLIEEAILAAGENNMPKMMEISKRLMPLIREAYQIPSSS